ncbi:MAG: thioesterase family protein [Dokdonella sp.]
MNAAAQPKPIACVPIRIRWRDLDAFNHVNNSTFLTYLEEARLHWFSGLGDGWISDAGAPVIAASQVNFRRQLTWPGEIIVELFVERVGTTSLTIAHRIVGANEDHLYSDGSVVLVWVAADSGRPVPLPEVVRNASE